MRRFFIFSLLITLVSCGPKVYIDYDTKTDFEEYETYNFYDPSNSGLNELDNERVMDAIENELDSLGKEPKVIPDFSIEFYAELFVENQPHNVGVSFGGAFGAVGGSVPANYEKEMISLTINFADALTDELFWQAVIEEEFDKEMTPEERNQFFKELVKEALSKYPPDEINPGK